MGDLLIIPLSQTESQIVPSTTVLHQAFFPPKKSPWVQLLWWASGSFANVMLTMVAVRLPQTFCLDSRDINFFSVQAHQRRQGR